MIVRYHALARQEVIRATNYYAQVSSALAADFLEKFNAAEAMIAADPIQFEQVRPGVRRCLLDRFPYGIYYRMPNPSTVRIIVVKHHRRRPGLGMRRT